LARDAENESALEEATERLKKDKVEPGVKLLAGHKDGGNMTNHYTHVLHVRLEPLRDAVEKLDYRGVLKGF